MNEADVPIVSCHYFVKTCCSFAALSDISRWANRMVRLLKQVVNRAAGTLNAEVDVHWAAW